jgi:Stress responsive A/B Barrel Domain
MLIHIVSFKYNAEVDAKARQDHRHQLLALAELAGILDLKVGEDVVRSPRSYDTGLVIRFRDRASLDAYRDHPRHVPVAQLGARLSEHIVAVDFEA